MAIDQGATALFNGLAAIEILLLQWIFVIVSGSLSQRFNRYTYD
jgi:hypothetical protein